MAAVTAVIQLNPSLPAPARTRAHTHSCSEREKTAPIVLFKIFVSLVYSSGLHSLFGVRSERRIIISVFYLFFPKWLLDFYEIILSPKAT